MWISPESLAGVRKNCPQGNREKRRFCTGATVKRGFHVCPQGKAEVSTWKCGKIRAKKKKLFCAVFRVYC